VEVSVHRELCRPNHFSRLCRLAGCWFVPAAASPHFSREAVGERKGIAHSLTHTQRTAHNTTLSHPPSSFFLASSSARSPAVTASGVRVAHGPEEEEEEEVRGVEQPAGSGERGGEASH
jgi:hypothetical protein